MHQGPTSHLGTTPHRDTPHIHWNIIPVIADHNTEPITPDRFPVYAVFFSLSEECFELRSFTSLKSVLCTHAFSYTIECNI